MSAGQPCGFKVVVTFMSIAKFPEEISVIFDNIPVISFANS